MLRLLRLVGVPWVPRLEVVYLGVYFSETATLEELQSSDVSIEWSCLEAKEVRLWILESKLFLSAAIGCWLCQDRVLFWAWWLQRYFLFRLTTVSVCTDTCSSCVCVCVSSCPQPWPALQSLLALTDCMLGGCSQRCCLGEPQVPQIPCLPSMYSPCRTIALTCSFHFYTDTISLNHNNFFCWQVEPLGPRN